MAASQGNTTIKRKKKLKKRSDPGAGLDEEELNPGILLKDFIDEPAPGGGGESWNPSTGWKASETALQSAVSRGKVKKKKVKAKRPAADSSDGEGGEGDLLSFGQAAAHDEGEEALASAKLLGAINAAGQARAGSFADTRRPRHAEEALPENEFHAGAGGEEITVEDLLAPLQESTGFGDVKKLLQGMSKKEAMPEPMSDVKQGREDRQQRYTASSRDVAKWLPQVQRMRKADQIPLAEPKDFRPNSTSALVGTFRPLDDFEKELEEVTKAAGATEADFIDHKGLPMNTRLRDAQQTQQVARLRALMSREQQSSKRIKKIKSKTYHRIHRKAEVREREVLLERLERDNPEMAKSLRQDYEKKHAEKRLLRHRNARRKWAQTMNRFAKNDDGARHEITKQAQIAQDEQRSLRRAIAGKDVDQSDDSEAMDLSDSDGEGGKKGLAQRTVDKSKNLMLRELTDLKKNGDDELPTTGILGLSFMRNAIKQKRAAAKTEAQSVLNELEGLGARLEVDSDADSTEREKRKKAASSQPAQKRREFTAEELEQAAKDVDLMLEQEDVTQAHGVSVSGPLTVRGVEAQQLPARPQTKQSSTSASSSSAPAAGAQSRSASTSGQSRKESKNPWLADASESNPWLAMDSAEPAADAATPSTPSSPGKKTKRKGAADTAVPGSRKRKKSANEASGERDETEENATSAADLLNVLDADAEAQRQQRDLVRATFVEGTQAEDFDEEKDDKLRAAEEKDKPSTMVGWGSWTGAGMKPPRPKAAPKRPAAPKAAARNSLQHSTPKPSHVQVYEGDAAVKAQAKYFVDKVPFPFQSPAQYDREMRMPSGPEWNTLAGHLQRVKPKIFMKVGAVVPPLQYIKHLPVEQQEGAINTWAKGKQPKRMKARF